MCQTQLHTKSSIHFSDLDEILQLEIWVIANETKNVCQKKMDEGVKTGSTIHARAEDLSSLYGCE